LARKSISIAVIDCTDEIEAPLSALDCPQVLRTQSVSIGKSPGERLSANYGDIENFETLVIRLVIRGTLGQLLTKGDDQAKQIYAVNVSSRVSPICDVESDRQRASNLKCRGGYFAIWRREPHSFQSQTWPMGRKKFSSSKSDLVLARSVKADSGYAHAQSSGE
jgi:hypothetical protein